MVAAAPVRTTLLCSLFVLAGCLNNPKKPEGGDDDAGAEAGTGFDGSGQLGDARLDTSLAPDVRLDLAPEVLTPAEPPPDGAVVEVAPDVTPDLAPETGSCTPACTEGAKRCG